MPQGKPTQGMHDPRSAVVAIQMEQVKVNTSGRIFFSILKPGSPKSINLVKAVILKVSDLTEEPLKITRNM